MAFTGDIIDFPLPEVVQLIAMGRKTGKLTIDNDGEGICICFTDGFAVCAHPLYQKDKIGNILVRNGIVNSEHIDAALYKQRKLKKKDRQLRIGTILVDMGYLTEEDLVFFIENEIKNTIYKVLSENRGKYEFTNDYDLSEQDIVGSLNVENTILEGMRQIDEWGEITRTLGDFDSVYVISVDPEYDFGKFTINEWKVITLIDGKRSINEINLVAKLDRLDVCKTLSELLKEDIIRLIETPPEKVMIDVADYVKPKTGFLQKIVEKIRSI